MEIIITAWALDSYLELKASKVFLSSEYNEIIRPDVLKLKNYPNDPSFMNGKFWSVASDDHGQIAGGFKMKWHNFGAQRAQLRLTVCMIHHAYLCQAYVKTDAKYEKRQLAKFKVRLALIEKGQYTESGRLS
jgi:hypothetical protein